MAYGRTIFIGDVHGCYDELRALLRQLKPRGGDRLVFLGDIVDKGRHSAACVALVRKTVARFKGSVCILGNHDKRWARMLQKGKPTPEKLAPEDERFLLSMPLFHRLPDIGWFAVHGGLFPRLLGAGPLTEEDAQFPHKDKKRGELLEKVAHVRQVSSWGDFVPLGKETAETVPWPASYDGREGVVVYGHEPARRPMRGPFTLGLDTGCCYGWSLTAAVLHSGDGFDDGIEFVSVPALQAYAERLAKE